MDATSEQKHAETVQEHAEGVQEYNKVGYKLDTVGEVFVHPLCMFPLRLCVF